MTELENTAAPFAGIILCGGASRRMGRSKAWLPCEGTTMLRHVAELLGSVLDPILVVAAEWQELPDLPSSVSVLRDTVPQCGPIGGLATGLAALPPSVPGAFVTSVDAPFLCPQLPARLIRQLGDAPAVVPRVKGRLHPLTAVYTTRARAEAERMIAEGQLRMTEMADRMGARIVEEDALVDIDPELRSFWNINTPEDFRRAFG